MRVSALFTRCKKTHKRISNNKLYDRLYVALNFNAGKIVQVHRSHLYKKNMQVTTSRTIEGQLIKLT